MKKNGQAALLDNFRRLWEDKKQHGVTQEAFAKELKVSQKTVSNLLAAVETGRHVRVDTVESIAQGLGIETWLLFVPDIPLDMLKNHRLPKLITGYVLADEKGRQYISRVAEMESDYGGKKVNKINEG